MNARPEAVPGVDGAEGRKPSSDDSNTARESTTPPSRLEAWRGYRDYADKQEDRDKQHERDCLAAAELARSMGDVAAADRIAAEDRKPQLEMPYGPDGRPRISLDDIQSQKSQLEYKAYWGDRAAADRSAAKDRKPQLGDVHAPAEFQAAEPATNEESDPVREAKLFVILAVRLMSRAFTQKRLCPASVAMALGIDRRSPDEIATATKMKVRTLQDHRAHAEMFMNYEVRTLEEEYATDAPPGFHLKLFWVKDGDNSNRCPLCHAESVGDVDSVAPSA